VISVGNSASDNTGAIWCGVCGVGAQGAGVETGVNRVRGTTPSFFLYQDDGLFS